MHPVMGRTSGLIPFGIFVNPPEDCQAREFPRTAPKAPPGDNLLRAVFGGLWTPACCLGYTLIVQQVNRCVLISFEDTQLRLPRAKAFQPAVAYYGGSYRWSNAFDAATSLLLYACGS